tara:strand:- start:40 stop:267 length:228 start_codon:yes stop_codon:yes gene_type:complete
MQLIGLLLLVLTSWYIWKLTSKFLDEPTKKDLSNNYEVFKKDLSDLRNRFSKANLSKLWEKYKKEDNDLSGKNTK